MAEPFTEVASIDYPIIDADAHVNEPPGTWQDRVPARLRDRAPQVVHTDGGDVWSFDGGKSVRPVGLTATAGLSYLDFRPSGITYDSMRPGSFDTKARLADLDADGIYAQVLYPSVTLSGAKMYGSEPELQLACVRAYNEWLAEFCDGSDGRLIGQGILATTGVDDAIAETERIIDLGHRGVVISVVPERDPRRRARRRPVLGLRARGRHPRRGAHRQLREGARRRGHPRSTRSRSWASPARARPARTPSRSCAT